ncbi:hypothetical protein [Mangrovimonas sp. DI 80]|uniref:hypothetical protein n=1 Tax=Mangrovimonas sp. DI 80 TaxID=1779330 RepID=UPI000976F905|nr:hypothetical protein [Mangrovimonas sp. DI 80]OMP32218.1 hypothetical protein BKM32_03980 [Mangrovimonas sp. DI 80]
MNKNLPETNTSEEVDLGQLFTLIGSLFTKLFNFIGSIFTKLFYLFVALVFFIKKNILILIGAGVIGLGFGIFKEKTKTPVYSSNAVIKQNYDTGESLFNLLNYYNDLIMDKDFQSLSEALNITIEEARNMVFFKMESVLNNNQKLKVYDEFKKEIDSTLADYIDFERFLDNSYDYDFEYQRLTVSSTQKNLLKKVLPEIIKNIESIEFFKNEQKKDLDELKYQEEVIMESLRESDSLQKVYHKVLEKLNENPNSQTSILIDNTGDKNSTKEYELFSDDIKLRRELVRIKREKDEINKIVEVISSQQDEGILTNSKELFKYNLGYKSFYSVLLLMLTFLVLIGLRFLKYLDQFKEKI